MQSVENKEPKKNRSISLENKLDLKVLILKFGLKLTIKKVSTSNKINLLVY